MFKIYLLFGILVVGASGYAYHQVTVANLEKDVMRLETDNRTLKENQVQLKSAVSTAQASLEAEKKNAAKTQVAMNTLSLRNNELNQEKQNYLKVFKDHNLTRLARARPGMIEKRANNKTALVFRELENDTKELMGIDDTDVSGVQRNTPSGVGAETTSSGASDSNGN
jgi:hypothetical protein